MWDLASGTLKLSLTGHIATVRGVAVSPRHPYLFSCGEDKLVKCWDLECNKVIRHYHGHMSGVYAMALHPTLDVLVTSGRDSVARVWDMRTRQSIHILTGHSNTVASLATAPIDPQITTGSMDSTIRLWDLAAGKTMATLTHHKKSVRGLWNNGCGGFVSAGGPVVKRWRYPRGDFLGNLQPIKDDHNLTILNCITGNDSGVVVAGGLLFGFARIIFLCLADNGTMSFWDYASGYKFQQTETIAQPGSLESEAGVFCARFDQSGARLITGEADKSIKIWKEVSESYRQMVSSILLG